MHATTNREELVERQVFELVRMDDCSRDKFIHLLLLTVPRSNLFSRRALNAFCGFRSKMNSLF